MTATDELRRLLDERGVEWIDPIQMEDSEFTRWNAADGTQWTASEVTHSNGKLRIGASFVTPAQAIAATLRAESCRYELKDGRFVCSNCGRSTWAYEGKGDPLSPPRFCPDCGARVEVDE